MDITQLGAQLLKQVLGTQSSQDSIASALTQLLGGSGGKIDIAGLVAKLAQNGNVQTLLNSWLGDGANAAITPAQIAALFGDGKLGGFAQQLGVTPDAAAGGLATVLPQLIDKASSGGSLLDSAGGLGGLLGAAKKFF